MEHSCHHCGSPVEGSSPFCPACNAPQVQFAPVAARAGVVLVPQAAISAPAPVEAGPVPPPPDATFRNQNAAFRSAAGAGLVGALLSLLPLGFLLAFPLAGFLSVLLAFPLAGFLSVLFYRRRTWGVEPSPRAGFRLGALSGALGFAMFVVLAAINTLVTHNGSEMRQAMIEAVHRQQARTPDPQARQVLDYFLTPNGLAVMIIVGLVFMCVVFILLAGLGGGASASLLRRKGPSN